MSMWCRFAALVNYVVVLILNSGDNEAAHASVSAVRLGAHGPGPLQLILDTLIDVNRHDALLTAVQANQTEAARVILRRTDLSVNACNSKGETALIVAVAHGWHGMVHALLTRIDLDINSMGTQGETALMIASRLGLIAIVAELFGRDDLRINGVDWHGKTAVMLATEACQGEIIVMFIKFRSDLQINTQDHLGRSALHLAVLNCPADIVNLLSAHPKIDVNLADRDGYTALHEAVRYEDTACVAALLQRDDINDQIIDDDGYFMTAVQWAQDRRYTSVVDEFHFLSLYNAVTMNTVDEKALIRAVRLNHYSAVSGMITLNPAIINAVNGNGWTSLMIASFRGYEDIMDRLLAAPHVDVDAECTAGSALMLAACSGQLGAVRRLLSIRCHGDLVRFDRESRVALKLAQDHRNYQVAEWIISRRQLVASIALVFNSQPFLIQIDTADLQLLVDSFLNADHDAPGPTTSWHQWLSWPMTFIRNID